MDLRNSVWFGFFQWPGSCIVVGLVDLEVAACENAKRVMILPTLLTAPTPWRTNLLEVEWVSFAQSVR